MTDKEKQKEKWSIMRKIGKKGYVQFRTVSGRPYLLLSSQPHCLLHCLLHAYIDHTISNVDNIFELRVSLQTCGELNVEVRCDCVPATGENFLTLCKSGKRSPITCMRRPTLRHP
jgi:hypothetical protein